MDEKNKPIKKFAAGCMQVSIWKNLVKKETPDDKELYTETKSVSMTKRYKDKDGEWKSCTSLRPDDIPKAITVLRKAYEEIYLKDFS